MRRRRRHRRLPAAVASVVCPSSVSSTTQPSCVLSIRSTQMKACFAFFAFDRAGFAFVKRTEKAFGRASIFCIRSGSAISRGLGYRTIPG